MTSPHTFHIPVMGLSYTLDTPIKVARYGITSVVSIIQDDLIERARHYYSRLRGIDFKPIDVNEASYRSKRITAYLNLMNQIVEEDFELLKSDEKELAKYAHLLPREVSVQELKANPALLRKGDIDVNIMTKLDREPEHGEVLTEASAALVGYANSDLESALVLSAGLNPRLFAEMEHHADFYPDANGKIKKRIILKVSDYRSGLLQGKMLAKRGIFVSEFRIESGLNCGGHTFATDGLLMGPILKEFKENRLSMAEEQFDLCVQYWEEHNIEISNDRSQKITAQGGLGTAGERELLENIYQVDSTGWGSPFLLVPEATSIDDETLDDLIHARESDIYNSPLSPLGVPFNTLRTSGAARLRHKNIAAGKSGNPCYRKHLALDTTYKATGMCTASVTYQNKKIKELENQNLTDQAYLKAKDAITSKECLCDGLSVSFYKKFGISKKKDTGGVAICPGPNLAYFDRIYSLNEMVDHIYGRCQVITKNRPHTFIKELGLYLQYFEDLLRDLAIEPNRRLEKRINTFQKNLRDGIEYYRSIISSIHPAEKDRFINELNISSEKLDELAGLEVVFS